MKPPGFKRNEIGIGIAGFLLAVLAVAGLLVVGYLAFIAIALANYGSSK